MAKKLFGEGENDMVEESEEVKPKLVAKSSQQSTKSADGVIMGAFLASSKKVREYSSYVIIGFQAWAKSQRESSPKKWAHYRPESEWEKLFLEYAHKKQ